MRFDIDDDYEFEENEYGDLILPDGVKWDGSLCILPNGRYLPRGHYIMRDGSDLIYEPNELNPLADLLAGFR